MVVEAAAGVPETVIHVVAAGDVRPAAVVTAHPVAMAEDPSVADVSLQRAAISARGLR